MEESIEVIEIAKNAEQSATEAIEVVKNKVAEVVQTSWAGDVFGVPFWELAAVFLIGALAYNIFFHKFFCDMVTKKRSNDMSRIYAAIYYTFVGVLLIAGSYVVALCAEFDIKTLVSLFMMFLMWTIAKYLQRFLDKYFVRWSKKKFGKRATMHHGVKGSIKVAILLVAAVFTFIVLRIGIMTFLDVTIPKYLVAVVIIPLLFNSNLLSYFSVISMGFIMGDFIQVGLDSDAVSGTCIDVSLSGVTLEMRNGERISLSLSYVADAVIINKSTMRSHSSDRVYYLNIDTPADALQLFEKQVHDIIDEHKQCHLVYCIYDIGAVYRHELHVVFDVEFKKLAEARPVMNEIHYKIVDICHDDFAPPALQVTK